MLGVASTTHAISKLGSLLVYPDAGFQSRFETVSAEIHEVSPVAGDHLDHFVEEVFNLSLNSAQELYTRVFDVNPLCVPYLSVHLFGQESFKRAELMTGLNEAFQRANFDRGAELPDHIGVVLQGAEHLEPDEWDELKQYCLEKPLHDMCARLDKAGSPWRHLLHAVRTLLEMGDGNDA